MPAENAAQRDMPGTGRPVLVIENVVRVQREVFLDQTETGVPFVHEVILVDRAPSAGDVFPLLMFFVILVVLVQLASYLWKSVHKKSFAVVSSAVLVLVPLFVAISNGSYLFILLWALFFATHSFLLRFLVTRRYSSFASMNIYRFYRLIFRITFVGSMLGFFMLSYGFFRNSAGIYGAGVPLLFYSLYFSLLGRNFINYIGDKITQDVLPSVSVKKESACGVCAENVSDAEDDKSTYVLRCNHKFHLDCLKGWRIVGKRDICPTCKERVDLEDVPMNPWQRNEYFFTQFLDLVGNIILSYTCLMVYLWRHQ